MCFPLAIPLALMVAGGGLNYFGEKKADRALTNTFNRERSRQKAFEQEQVGRFQDSLDSSGRLADPDEQAAAAANREAVFNALTRSSSPAAGGYHMPGSGSAPQVVADEAARAGSKADAETSSLARAFASLGGMGDLMQRNNINIGRNSQSIAQTGGFMRGSLDVLQSELDAAKTKGQTLRTLGGLAQSIGSSMLGGAMGGIGGGAGGGPIVTSGGGSQFLGGGGWLGGAI